MTEDEFVAWATDDVRAEWVDGEVILMSPASFRHAELNYWLAHVLALYVRHHKLGKVVGQEFMVRLQSDKVSRRVPDIIYISQANLKNIRTNHLEGPPDLAIEIVSPESRVRDYEDKPLEYEAAGVGEYWIIDPTTHSLQAHVRNAAGKFENLPIENGIVRSTVVRGFWIKLEWLWQEDPPDPLDCLRELGIGI